MRREEDVYQRAIATVHEVRIARFTRPCQTTPASHLNPLPGGDKLLRGLFRTKNLDEILAAAQDESHSLKRALGAFNVTLIGIGAIIGAGIFATVGTAAAGDASRPGAGPSLMISFV